MVVINCSSTLFTMGRFCLVMVSLPFCVRVCVYEYQAKLRIFRVMAIPTTGDGSAFFSKFGRDV